MMLDKIRAMQNSSASNDSLIRAFMSGNSERKRIDPFSSGVREFRKNPHLAAQIAVSALSGANVVRVPVITIATPDDIKSLHGRIYKSKRNIQDFFCHEGTINVNAHNYYDNKKDDDLYDEDVCTFPDGNEGEKGLCFRKVEDVVRHVGNKMFVMLDRNSLENLINGPAIDAGIDPLLPERGIFLNEMTEAAGGEGNFENAAQMLEECGILNSTTEDQITSDHMGDKGARVETMVMRILFCVLSEKFSDGGMLACGMSANFSLNTDDEEIKKYFNIAKEEFRDYNSLEIVQEVLATLGTNDGRGM